MNALDCIFGQDDGFQFKAKISDFGGGGAGSLRQVHAAALPAADSISGARGCACEVCRGDGSVNGFTCRRCGGKGVA